MGAEMEEDLVAIEEIQRHRAELAPLLDAGRNITLMLPMGAQFNDLPMLDGVKRLALIGRVLSAAVDENETVRQMVKKSGAVQVLRSAITQRQSGTVVPAPPFLPDLVAHVPQERAP
jgi:hypothetical protein